MGNKLNGLVDVELPLSRWIEYTLRKQRKNVILIGTDYVGVKATFLETVKALKLAGVVTNPDYLLYGGASDRFSMYSELVEGLSSPFEQDSVWEDLRTAKDKNPVFVAADSVETLYALVESKARGFHRSALDWLKKSEILVDSLRGYKRASFEWVDDKPFLELHEVRRVMDLADRLVDPNLDYGEVLAQLQAKGYTVSPPTRSFPVDGKARAMNPFTLFAEGAEPSPNAGIGNSVMIVGGEPEEAYKFAMARAGYSGGLFKFGVLGSAADPTGLEKAFGGFGEYTNYFKAGTGKELRAADWDRAEEDGCNVIFATMQGLGSTDERGYTSYLKHGGPLRIPSIIYVPNLAALIQMIRSSFTPYEIFQHRSLLFKQSSTSKYREYPDPLTFMDNLSATMNKYEFSGYDATHKSYFDGLSDRLVDNHVLEGKKIMVYIGSGRPNYDELLLRMVMEKALTKPHFHAKFKNFVEITEDNFKSDAGAKGILEGLDGLNPEYYAAKTSSDLMYASFAKYSGSFLFVHGEALNGASLNDLVGVLHPSAYMCLYFKSCAEFEEAVAWRSLPRKVRQSMSFVNCGGRSDELEVLSALAILEMSYTYK